MYKRISDYGVIGNLRTVALVGIDGSIDWLCLPFIDSPSVFAALLDDFKGGRFYLRPNGRFDSVARYLEGTNILETMMRTRTGSVRVLDFMPVIEGREGDEFAPPELYRMVEGVEGTVEMEILFEPRFDYARAEPSIKQAPGGVTASSGHEVLHLSCTVDMEAADKGASASINVRSGESLCLRLSYGESPDELDISGVRKLLDTTAQYWRGWLSTTETGRTYEPGVHREMVERSALVLKLLLYEPTGAIAAAATTSLPEVIGGERNWDYRYTWVRDTSFTIQALFDLGHLSETQNYLSWLDSLMDRGGGVDGMRIMYGLRGEEDLKEMELAHLDGYKGSRPVRIGNGAAEQVQLDIYGELMDASLRLSDYVGKISADAWPFLRQVCDLVLRRWREPDAGIWEVRGGPFHFVYSKIMCWVALDRGITIARRYGFQADLAAWERESSLIKDEVLKRGWDPAKGAFRQHYDTDALDASSLLVSALGFLPPEDPRVTSNLEAVERELSHDGFVYRYTAHDGLGGREGTFLLCTLWYIDALIDLGRLDHAELQIARVEGVANHLGLFSEEYDVLWQESLGNFPQAFTHIGYINSVMSLIRARAMERRPTERPERLRAVGRMVMNMGEPPPIKASPRELAERLKGSMNVLRGAFFDTLRGRVAYENMRGSEPYQEYLRLSYALRQMDLATLLSEEEKLAFWINLYNVGVIHGVVELGVRDSIKEVRAFFKRVVYDVGGMQFSLSDMEHGMLRCNRRPPGGMLRPFRHADPRLNFDMKTLDPRVHFALVCASSSCPPIGAYTPEGIYDELDIAARTFINSGGMVLMRETGVVSLSAIFKWYARDFGRNVPERLRFAAGFLYDEAQREYIQKNAHRLRVSYQQYDWRLNRS